jgi:S-adenosylmethionine hydrolase
VARPVITFLSDYGLQDDFVGVCHGVMARVAPDARVIDVTHGVPRHDVRAGALILRRALPSMPARVHLPWSTRPWDGRAAHRGAHGRGGPLLVGPDNGLPVARRPALRRRGRGGGHLALVHRPEPVSATFHGRDLFAPSPPRSPRAPSLAAAGDSARRRRDQPMHMPLAQVEPDGLVAHAIGFDRFGNVTLDVEHEELTFAGLRLGRSVGVNGHTAHYGVTFADVRRASSCSTRTPTGRSPSP